MDTTLCLTFILVILYVHQFDMSNITLRPVSSAHIIRVSGAG